MKAHAPAQACLLVSALLLSPACRQPVPPPSSPSTPACSPQVRGSNVVQRASARTAVGESQYTLDVSSATAALERGAGGGSAVHLMVRRDGAPVLQVDAQLGEKGELQIRVLQGAGYHGAKEGLFTSADRETLQGTIDGKAIAPFSIRGDRGSMRLADGSAAPPGSVDEDVKQALAALGNEIRQQCRPPPPAPAPPGPDGAGGGDPPGHFSDTMLSAGCISCMAGAGVVEVGCVVAAAVAADTCLYWAPLCLAVGIASCEAGYFIALQTGCHVAVFGGAAGGGPCCPVGCGGSECCDVAETCVGTIGLCCSPTFKPCGSGMCCASTETCMSDGTCCASVCGSKCCGAGEVCVNSLSSTCCPGGHACGTSCCAATERCADPNHGTCEPCAGCTSSGDECCGSQCCHAPDVCDATTQTCVCTPSCAGKCGGAPDGCGGTCTGACPGNEACVSQRCCRPSCVGKCDGAPDGCGGVCNGECPPSQICVGQRCKRDETACKGGLVDCCGDGRCCAPAVGSGCNRCSCR